jgi:hypothetical protein
VPPRSLKSICVSVALPAYALGLDPTARIVCVSYSESLARKHANDSRALMRSSLYRRLFPGTRISSSKDTELEVMTTKRGFRLATSVGGTLTGRGSNLIIIDDPIKPQDSESTRGRMSCNSLAIRCCRDSTTNQQTQSSSSCSDCIWTTWSAT